MNLIQFRYWESCDIVKKQIPFHLSHTSPTLQRYVFSIMLIFCRLSPCISLRLRYHRCIFPFLSYMFHWFKYMSYLVMCSFSFFSQHMNVLTALLLSLSFFFLSFFRMLSSVVSYLFFCSISSLITPISACVAYAILLICYKD